MLIKKYKIIYTIYFERVESNYLAPCFMCKLCNRNKYLCKSEFKFNKSIFYLCIKASDKINKYNYIYRKRK